MRTKRIPWKKCQTSEWRLVCPLFTRSLPRGGRGRSQANKNDRIPDAILHSICILGKWEKNVENEKQNDLIIRISRSEVLRNGLGNDVLIPPPPWAISLKRFLIPQSRIFHQNFAINTLWIKKLQARVALRRISNRMVCLISSLRFIVPPPPDFISLIIYQEPVFWKFFASMVKRIPIKVM